MLQQVVTALTDADITALGHSIACVLRSGRVSEQQALVLRSALDGLQYCRHGILGCLSALQAATHTQLVTCSVGVYVQEFGTVITTDCLLTPGFFDLSLCPTRSAMAGCVVSQGKAFHDNTSVLRCGPSTFAVTALAPFRLCYAALDYHCCSPLYICCCRSGFPVDIAHAVQRYSIKSAVCVPVRLAAVVSEGDVVASERILGTLTLASCHLDAVTPQ